MIVVSGCERRQQRAQALMLRQAIRHAAHETKNWRAVEAPRLKNRVRPAMMWHAKTSS